MEKIKFKVEGQSISMDRPALVSDTRKVYQCEYQFSDDWEGYVKWAVFKGNCDIPYRKLIVDNKCEFESASIYKSGYVVCGVVGYKDDKRKPTIYTSPALVQKGTDEGCIAPIPSPTEWEQVIEYMAKIENFETYIPEGTSEENKLVNSDTLAEELERVEGEIPTKYSDLENDNHTVQDENYVHTDNNFTNTEKTKLEGIEENAQANVQADWNETDSTKDEFIKNKPQNIVVDENYVHTDNNYTTSEKQKLAGINLSLYSLVTETGKTIELSLNSTTYVLTATLKDKNGNLLSSSNVDLPLEEMIVSMTYDSTTKELVITLKSGSVTRIPIGDIISGLATQSYVDNAISNHHDSTKQDTLTNGNYVSIDENHVLQLDTKMLMRVIKIDDLATTLGDVKDIVDEANENGEHVIFDFSTLGTRMYLCTITFDDSNCKIVDLVTGRIAETTYNEDKLLNVVLANANEIATQNQIDYLQREIDELGGGEGEVGDEIIAQFAQTVSCTTLSGLTATCSDVDKFVNGVGEAENNASYLFVYDGTKWEYNEQPITISDFGISVSGTIPTGEVMTCVVSTTNAPYKIVSKKQTGTNATVPSNVNEANFMMVEATYCGTTSYVFDEPESAICVTEGYTLPAGKYYVYNVAGATGDYWCNYKRLYYCFEILHDIIATAQTGDIQLRFSSRGNRETTGDARGVYQLYTKPTKCIDDSLYNSDTILFEGQIAQPSSEYTDIRTIENFTTNQTMDSEGIIYNNLGHVCYGNTEFNVSNIRQRLNSSAKAMQPVRLHKNDIVTSLKNVKGYMYGLDPRFKAKILNAKKYLQHALSDEFTRGSIYSFDVDCFLLSMKEMSFNIQTDEGLATELYSIYTENTLTNNAIASRGKADKAGQSPSNYRWSASSSASSSYSARLVSATGAADGSSSASAHRFAPAYLLKS